MIKKFVRVAHKENGQDEVKNGNNIYEGCQVEEKI